MKSIVYKKYLLFLLLVIHVFNFIDRQVLALVLQDIKIEFDLSDTQLGLVSGIAFALFYSAMGIPIARWADRGNRVTIITVTTALWSAMVALCGFVGNFAQLLMVRIGVAVGEAGCMPPAHSLIADYFSRRERPRAVSIYMLGAPISVVIGFFAGGWLNEFYGWRATFLILGLPGVLLAVLVRFTLHEPRLEGNGGGLEKAKDVYMNEQRSEQTLIQAFIVLWQQITFRNLLFAFALVYLFSYGIGQWQPVFFIRSHGMQTGELGTWFALIWGLGAMLGVYMGGVLASRYAENNETLQLRVMAGVYALFAFVSIFIYLTSDKYVALGLMGLSAIVGSIITGPMFAIIQTLVEPRLRATSIALIYLFANLIGMGLGPLASGVLSDALMPVFGQESLRYALVALCPGYLLAALHVWFASRTVSSELADGGADCELRKTTLKTKLSHT